PVQVNKSVTGVEGVEDIGAGEFVWRVVCHAVENGVREREVAEVVVIFGPERRVKIIGYQGFWRVFRPPCSPPISSVKDQFGRGQMECRNIRDQVTVCRPRSNGRDFFHATISPLNSTFTMCNLLNSSLDHPLPTALSPNRISSSMVQRRDP